jgi:hypothetical protein
MEHGPIPIFDTSRIRQFPKNGDRLFGHILVQCSDCVVAHDYWLFIRYGQDAWYSPLKKGEFVQEVSVTRVLTDFKKDVERYLLAFVPLSSRVPVKD